MSDFKTRAKFVDDLAETRGLHIGEDLRRASIESLRIAGIDPTKRPSLAVRVVDKVWTRHEPQGTFHTSGGRVSTAAVVSAGQNCPRCGEPMVDVNLSDGTTAAYCRNPRCRVSAYRS